MSSSSPPNTTPERRSGGDDNSSSHAAVAAALRENVDIVTPAKNDCDRVDGGDGNDCSVNNEEENLTEIKDLQRALEYLISDKRQSNIANNDEQEKTDESSVTSTTAQQHYNISGVDADDETLCQIPNLVNRIIVEHYSTLPPSQSHKRSDISYTARDKMTQLIIAVIVEFAEPYFVRITRHREEERLKQLMCGKEKGPQKKKSKRRKGAEEDYVVSSKLRFEDRAVSWATQCLKLLLQPSLSPSIGMQMSSNGSSNKFEANAMDDLHIPELDALLAATGADDRYEIEQRMQQSLLLGIHARSMFMSSYMARSHPKDIIEVSQR